MKGTKPSAVKPKGKDAKKGPGKMGSNKKKPESKPKDSSKLPS